MNSYERVVTVLNGGIPDRVPTFELMIDPKVIKGIIGTEDYMDLCDELDIDIIMSQTPSKMYREELVDPVKHIIRNEWGVLRQYNDEIVPLPLHGPIETLEDAMAQCDYAVVTLAHDPFKANKQLIASKPYYDCVGLMR